MRQCVEMGTSRKPVIVRKFTRDWVSGYADSTFPAQASTVEILDLAGKVVSISWTAVKWICYVRDFASGEQSNPERLLQKRFTVRPRAAGLWLRMTLTDGEEIEGLAANDRSLIDGPGLLLIPPDTRSNTQRIYIPRTAIQTLEIVSMIGAGSRRRPTVPPQPELFPTDPAQ